MCVDGSGNVYVAGYVGAAIDGQVYNGGSQDVVLIKYTTSGSKVWTRLAGSTSNEVGNAGKYLIVSSICDPLYLSF